MKKLLSLLAIVSFALSNPIFLNDNNKISDINSSNLNKVNPVSNHNKFYNPLYPPINANTIDKINVSDNDNHGGGSLGSNANKTFKLIKWNDYAPDWNTFSKHYEKITLQDLYGSVTLGEKNTSDSSNTPIDIVTSDTSEHQWLHKFDGSWDDAEMYGYYSLKHDDQYLQINFKFTHPADDTHTDSYSYKLSKISLTSIFDVNDFEQKIINSLSKNFNFTSDTSDLIDSEDRYSINGEVTSNKEIIKIEIDKRLKNSFDVDYDAWFGGDKPILKVNLQFDNIKNIVYITLKDENTGIVGDNQFVISNVAMQVNLSLSDDYWQLNLQRRLSISPSKIVDPSDSYNNLILDNPEYYPDDNHTYIYHNAVDISFTAHTSSEILNVNGTAVPVYNNKFYIRLADNKMTNNNSESNSKYEVTITDNGDIKMTINIKIESVNSFLNFKWLGWNPINDPSQSVYYEQYLLITPTINGETNPKYDSTINADTGTRQQFIGINYNFKDAFAFDPLNKYGNLINNSKDYEPFYIAQGVVVNSGFSTLIENTESIDHIERVKVEPLTLNELSQRQVVDLDNELQFSQPGLWHYIIYMKDYVKEKVDPTNPGNEKIEAIQGSTLHQFVYIDNSANSYASFLNQIDIAKNKDITDLWSSIHAKHLKFYLANDIGMSTNEITKLDYAQIISFWNQYVSDAIEQLVDINPDPTEYKDLTNLNIASLKMNAKSENDIKENIKNYVNEKVTDFASKSIYKSDYEIVVNGQLLENADLSQYVLPESSSEEEIKKEFSVSIVATAESTILENSQSLKIINDSKYDKDIVLNLENVLFQNYEYNFSNWNENEKNQFLQNYVYDNVTKYLEKYKPNKFEGEYVYGVDYLISLEGLNGIDIKTQDDIDQILNSFFMAKESTTLKFTIYALDDSMVLEGFNSFEITNNPDSDDIAPPIPPDPDTPGQNDKNNHFNKKHLYWIIPLVIIGVSLITLIVILIIRRKRKKIR
ncbi:Mbov_0399 family ICE element protein [Spiroplasma endosymbiont of Labia minor]|uniref:Mbov_0399 family ICE element protein n=1 Tax=Spiroplasma endosymbiont of Labia minor TaxID=3066305 RepID=UPI0030CBA55F